MLKNLAFYVFVAFVTCGMFLCLLPYPTFYSGTYNLSKDDISKINFSSEVENYDFSTMPIASPVCLNLDWSSVNAMLDFNTNFQIVDIKSEIVFNAYRVAGQNHADIRPADEKDRLIICGLTENSNAPRPCLIKLKDNLWICASLSTKLQTDSDGQTHYCLYFKGSKSHATGQEDSQHEKAVNYALKNSQEIIKKIA